MRLFEFKNDESSYEREFVSRFDSLEDKVSYYVEWCRKNDSERNVKDIKNIIDKVTVWYELRYSDSYLDQDDVSSIMFGNKANDCNKQDWSEFYTFDKFYYSLSKKEKELLDNPCFVDMIYLNNGHSHLHFYSDGRISDASDVILFDRFAKDGRYLYPASSLLDGKGIDEWPGIMKQTKIKADYVRINSIINDYKRRVSLKEGLLDTIMYNLIERGGKYYGPRRGILFAREFERDIKVPVSYGDASLALEYLANDGDESLSCYVDYFNGNLERRKIKDILKKQNLVDMCVVQKKKVFPKSCE